MSHTKAEVSPMSVFEAKWLIIYLTDAMRDLSKLSPLHRYLGTGMCPECGKVINVLSKRGVAGRDERRGENYFMDHHQKNGAFCPNSEQPFSIIIDK